MTNDTTAPSAGLLADYLGEDDVSREIHKSKRTLRQMRQSRTGPPWIVLGKTIYYPIDGFRTYLRSLEQPRRRPIGRRVAEAETVA